MEYRVTQDEVDRLLDSAEVQEHIFFGKELNVCYQLPNKFTITGRGAVVDPTRFDLEIGRKVAREDAANQIWKLLGYLRQQQMYDDAMESECDKTDSIGLSLTTTFIRSYCGLILSGLQQAWDKSFLKTILNK